MFQKKRFDRFSFISQPLKHLQKRLRAFSNSLFRGLLKKIQKLHVLVKIDRDIYKTLKTRKKSKCQKYWIVGDNKFSFPPTFLKQIHFLLSINQVYEILFCLLKVLMDLT